MVVVRAWRAAPIACGNDARILRSVVESGILAGVKEKFLAPEVVAEARRRVLRALKALKAPVVDTRRIDKLQGEVASLVEAIASGALAASPALAARLTASETELARLLAEAKAPAPKVSELRPRLEGRWRALVAGLESALTAAEVPKARLALRGIVGDVKVVTTREEIRLETQKGAIEGALLRAAGSQQINMVAGG